jgi:hypothetical protein
MILLMLIFRCDYLLPLSYIYIFPLAIAVNVSGLIAVLVVTLMYGVYNCAPETNHVPRV